MGHKFLENLKTYTPLNIDASDERQSRWAKEREIYGFDETETWSLDSTFYAWLYEHIKMYIEKGGEIVNLEYHKFEYKGITYTQLELLEQICKRVEYYYSDEYDDWDDSDVEYINEIGEMWALVLPAMWW